METKELFGGISLITVGDLFQLKPVFDKWIFESSAICYSALASNIWTENFILFELTEIMRQKDGREFAELLNHSRGGKHSEDDVAILEQRLLKDRPHKDNYPVNMTHLFTTNASVGVHNNTLYTISKTNKAQIKAVEIVVGILIVLYSFVSVTTMAKYDLTTNNNVTDGLTNDAECMMENINDRVENSTILSIIWVSFPHPEIGKKLCGEYAHLYKRSINKTGHQF